MGNEKFPYSFSVQYEKICWLKICIYNKEMSWFRNTITDLYNALASRLESVRETATLLYERVVDNIRYGQETLKNIVKNAVKKEKGKRVQIKLIASNEPLMDCGLLPKWLRKKRCINALETFDDNLCVWRSLAITHEEM